ncbi:uncharacterized protein METZ01_LOCUS345737 [marine metagenome]|uniref:Uncharacterized protein n=1 Tax=marine metagenome TaxID=408172 RepID=A0A382R570_9ZZZZ
MQVLRAPQSLHRFHIMGGKLYRKQQTRAHGRAIQKYRAGAANTMLASHMCPG